MKKRLISLICAAEVLVSCILSSVVSVNAANPSVMPDNFTVKWDFGCNVISDTLWRDRGATDINFRAFKEYKLETSNENVYGGTGKSIKLSVAKKKD